MTCVLVLCGGSSDRVLKMLHQSRRAEPLPRETPYFWAFYPLARAGEKP